MKKVRGFMLLLLSAVLALVLLAGCEQADNVLSVCVKDHDPESVIEMAVGNFNYSDYTVDVVYASGATENLPLTESMIAPEDIFKFYQVGEHDIKVCYGNQSYVIKVSVKRSEFSGISFPEDCVFTYNGEAHTVELIGEIPSNATVSYPAGNSFVNAGVYEISAVLSCDGYATKVLNTTVTVERAKYDLSGITFDSKEVVYDGYGHYIEIAGELPTGVPNPTYTIDGRDIKSVTNVGEYTVLARFAHTNANYESIPDMTATLKITPAVYDLGDIDLIFKDANGNILTDSVKIYDRTSVFAEINDKSLIGSKIVVSYIIKDEDGNELYGENGVALTSFENAGSYTVTMSVALIDGKNYQPIAPITREFVIKKAKYDASQIHFDAGLAIYDGRAHKVLVEIPEGHDIKPEDVVYEYRLNGELLEIDASVGVINAGVYSVTAIFPDKNGNYEKLDDKTVTLKIEKQTVDTDKVIIFGENSREYNGESYLPTLQKLSETVG